MEQAVIQYLSHLNIRVSEKYVKKCMLSHPDYPSLLSVADTLERLGIHHRVGQIKEDDLDDAPFPYMLQLDRRGAELVLIKDEQDLADHNNDLEHWKGVVIKLEPTGAITDEEHNTQYATEKRMKKTSMVLLAALAALVVMPLLQSKEWLHFMLLATSLGAAAVGYLLIAKELGVTYRPVESFCNAGKRTNCERILNAQDAQLLPFFSFSDAVISYFTFQLIMAGLFIPLLGGAASYLWVLAVASVLTLPVIGYSLYYQQVKAQTWCRLCLIVDGLLAVQAVVLTGMYLSGLFALTDMALLPVALSIALFTAMASALLLLKNRLQAANVSARAETAAKRVKYDPKVFMNVLLNSGRAEVGSFEQEITIGNRNAPVQILMVANLHCNPCRIAFEAMTQLAATYPQKIGFSIRFTQGMNNTMAGLSASSYLIRYWQQHLHGQQNERVRTQSLIGDWYAQMNPEAFARKYPANGVLQANNNGTENLEDRHYRWVKENEIVRTPTFFVNGYAMPGSYGMDDLMPMIPGLAALLTEMNQQTKVQNQDLAQKQEG